MVYCPWSVLFYSTPSYSLKNEGFISRPVNAVGNRGASELLLDGLSKELAARPTGCVCRTPELHSPGQGLINIRISPDRLVGLWPRTSLAALLPGLAGLAREIHSYSFIKRNSFIFFHLRGSQEGRLAKKK